MISDIMQTILKPIIFVMQGMFNGLFWVTGSAGWSIVCLSAVIALATLPLRKSAQRLETRVRHRQASVDNEVKNATASLSGEEKFRATERIYEKHGYHPIQSLATGASFFVMLPFLLSALYLFSSNTALSGQSFLFISDLSTEDRIAWGVNVLPLLMTGVTVIDARIRFRSDRAAFVRFLFIAALMLALVYNFNAGIVLYWTISSLVAMLIYLVEQSRTPKEEKRQGAGA